jgi:formiminotetrahydrofolate cyclodeaminase
VSSQGEEPTAAGPAAAHAGAAAAWVIRAAAGAAGAGAGAAQAAGLARRLLQLGELDGQAFWLARAALSAATPDLRDERRDFALGQALERAAGYPLAIAEACSDVAALARELSPHVEPADQADVDAAALLAAGAAQAAAHLVEINLAVAPGDERLARARAAANG